MNSSKAEDAWTSICFEGVYIDVMKKIVSFKSNKKTCDVVINSSEKKIYAHKVILAANSLYFHSLFYGEFSEGQKTNSLMEIDLSQFQPKLVEVAIDNMYRTETRIPTDPSNLVEFLCLASFLQYSYLEEEISRVICEDALTPETSFLFLTVSSRVHDVDLQLKVIHFMKTHFQLILDTELLVEQDIDTLKMLLEQDDILLDSEYTMFEAVTKWVSFDLEKRIVHLVELLSCVRFEHIESDLMPEAILNHNLVKSSEALLNETKLFISNHTKIGQQNQLACLVDGSGIKTGSECSVTRKQRSYPEELVIFTHYNFLTDPEHYRIIGDPLRKCWRGGQISKYCNSFRGKYLPFKWCNDLYRLEVNTGLLEVFNVYVDTGYWQSAKGCELLEKEFAKVRHNSCDPPATLRQVCASENTLFILFEDSVNERYLACRFDLKSYEMIGNCEVMPRNVNPDSFVYTDSCIYAFSGNEFIQISFTVSERVKLLSKLHEHQNRKYLSAIKKNGVIYFGGGEINGRKQKFVDAYDIKHNAWRSVAEFVHARAYCQFVIYMNVLCAVGGNDGESATVEVFDEINNKWEIDTSLPYFPWDCKPTNKWPAVVLPSVPWNALIHLP